MRSRIFLDGGDPKETKEILSLLGSLDGQTTNPTLIAKNPEAQKRLAEGKKFTQHFENTRDYVQGKEEFSSLPQRTGATSGQSAGFTPKEAMDFYRGVVTELSGLLPKGSISIEVYADP